MDPSDFDLMVRLPHIMRTTNFDEIIKQQLEEENIPSNKKMTECEFTEAGLSHIPRILPDKDRKKRRTEDSTNSPLTGNVKSTMDKRTAVGQNLSSVMKEKANPDTQPQVLFDSSSSSQSRSTNAAACQVGPLIQSEETIHIKMAEPSCSMLMTKPSEINKSHTLRPVQLKRLSEGLDLFPSTDKSVDGTPFLPQQDVFDESHISKNGSPQNAGIDESEMILTIQKLVEAHAKFCSDTPRPGTEEWTVFRQQQLDAKIQKDLSKATIETTIKSIEENAVRLFETIALQSVGFAKQIPGFCEIDLDDQINLIKESHLEWSLINVIRSLNSDLKVITPSLGFHFTYEEMAILLSEEHVDDLREQAADGIWQTITEAEEALLIAITLTNTDRCTGLKNTQQIEKLHGHLVACLTYVVEKDVQEIKEKEDDKKIQEKEDAKSIQERYDAKKIHDRKAAKLIQKRKDELKSVLYVCRQISAKHYDDLMNIHIKVQNEVL